MEELLQQLAGKLGIATRFSDGGLVRKDYEVDDAVVRYIAERLGYKAGNRGEVEKSLADFEKRRWQQTLENIYVVEQGKLQFDAVVPAEQAQSFFALQIENKDTGIRSEVAFEVHPTDETYTIGKTIYVKLLVAITNELPVGYYNLTFTVADKTYKSTLAVAPCRCYENPALADGKIWGYALQLYSLRSERNWGVGDFTDLGNFIRMCARCGADIIGLNPLNVLVHSFPENASPYSSISRLFLNPIYIDVEAVPEFKPEDLSEIADKIAELRQSELIDYAEVYPLKISVLEKLYGRFMAVTVGTSSGLLSRLRATTCINLHCSKPSMISKVHISGAAGRPGKMNSKTRILRLSVNLPKNMPTVSAFLNICNLKPIASLNRLRPSLPSAG